MLGLELEPVPGQEPGRELAPVLGLAPGLEREQALGPGRHRQQPDRSAKQLSESNTKFLFCPMVFSFNTTIQELCRELYCLKLSPPSLHFC